MRHGFYKNYVNTWILEDRDSTSTNREKLFFLSGEWRKKVMEDPEKKLSKQKKKLMFIVMFMSKESYRKVWEEVKLAAENEMFLSSQNNGKTTESKYSLTNLGRHYSHITHLW